MTCLSDAPPSEPSPREPSIYRKPNPDAEPAIYATCIHRETGLRVNIWRKPETREHTDNYGITHTLILRASLETDSGQPAYRKDTHGKWAIMGDLGEVEVVEIETRL